MLLVEFFLYLPPYKEKDFFQFFLYFSFHFAMPQKKKRSFEGLTEVSIAFLKDTLSKLLLKKFEPSLVSLGLVC